MDKSLPITFIIHKFLPIIQLILVKINKSEQKNLLPNDPRAINPKAYFIGWPL